MYKPDPEKTRVFWTSLQDVWLKLYGSAFPTAAAINVRHQIVIFTYLFTQLLSSLKF